MKNFGFYLVMTNPLVGYEHCAEAVVRAEVPMVQLRMKGVERKEIERVARRIRSITEGSKTTFIVNDDPFIAEACGADGVHLGQGDMSLVEARRRFKGLKIFGLSTHSREQLIAGMAQGPDYVGVGPIFPTPTKAIPDPTVGVELGGALCQLATCPAVAIGGIDGARLAEVIRAGARNYAVVRAVCASPTPYRAILDLLAIAEEAGIK